jgi:cellulose synthase/poly-beta-1,6-N-acetylglucosamine synthase-like glycosyltransferase
VLWLWFIAGPAIALALLSLGGERRRAEYVRMRLAAQPAAVPPATVIVPVKGPDEDLRENLAALAALDYPDYELLVSARTAADIPPGVLPARVKVVVGRSDDPSTGDKIQNLLAGVKASRKRTDVFAFADSDVRVSPGWLRALVAPLDEPAAGASTGYRWHTPEPANFASLLRSVWDAVAFGSLDPGGCRFAWGGSMAIRKEEFFELRVPDFWKGQVSDDYALTAAVRAAGLRIAFAPGALAACTEHVTAREFLAWARRQLMLTRAYDPRLWSKALASHALYCAAMAAGVAALASGNWQGAAALTAQIAPGMLKGRARIRIARRAMPEWRAWFRRHGWAHVVLVPVATWLWLAALLASAAGKTVKWRGNRVTLSG